MSGQRVSKTSGVKRSTTTHKTTSATKKDKPKVNVPVAQSTDTQKQTAALKKVENNIKSGTISYTKTLFGDDTCSIYFGEEPITLGDVKARYNLADGALLKNNKPAAGGGNFDRYPCYKDENGQYYATIEAKDLAAATGLTKEQLKGKFPPGLFR